MLKLIGKESDNGFAMQIFTEEELAFQRRISERNGLGEETYLPTAHHTSLTGEVTMEDARDEARTVLFSCVSEILERTGECPCPCLNSLINGCWIDIWLCVQGRCS
jgi:hypothetical protein